MTEKQSLFCLSCADVHEFGAVEVERIVYALQAAEHDAAVDSRADWSDPTWPGRESDTYECLREILRGSHEVELYAEHVEQQVLRRRDRAGPVEGDQDVCRHCGELITYRVTREGSTSLALWAHVDRQQWVRCRRPEPDPERQP